MTVFSSHLRAREAPVLVAEEFSWAAFIFGFLFLGIHRAWISAALNLAAFLLALALARAAGTGAPILGLAVLQGYFAQDLRRWELARRGFASGPLVAALNEDQAFARLLDARTDLLPNGSV